MPASSLMKVWPWSVPVWTMSWTEATSAPALATRNVPGSISMCSLRPCFCPNSSNTSLTTAQSVCRFVPFSDAIRPTLYPPPRLSVVTSENFSHSPIDNPVHLRHTAGSEPDPMWVWIRTTLQPPAFAISLHLSANSCQIPKDEDGPPTLVFPVPPEPTPGLNRRPSSLPGHLDTNFSSWRTEQQLILTPMATSSSKPSPSSCEESEHCSGLAPAAIARRTS
mmetsp:Transcript_8206/g.16182  ORF Transcript_8206/g.16182 Transcript_8206/m.16182 type:complete len:222 (-) Transcript_8206:236-901(-)